VPPVPGSGRHLQQPVHVADVADAVLNAVERPAAAGHCYDVAGPEPFSFTELLRSCAPEARQPDPAGPGAAGPSRRRRAATRYSAAAGRGQGLRHQRRHPRSRLRNARIQRVASLPGERRNTLFNSYEGLMEG